MTRLSLVRHGQDESDSTGARKLSNKGLLQAAALAQWAQHALADVDVDVVTSSLPRAQETAQVVACALDREYRVDPRLNEIEGHGRIPRLRRSSSTDEESWPSFVARVGSFLEDFSAVRDIEVLAITHSGVFDAIFELVTGSSNVELQVDHGALSVWRHRPHDPEGEWLLKAHNMKPPTVAVGVA